jgi:two-component system, sensor histidine kinase LadS
MGVRPWLLAGIATVLLLVAGVASAAIQPLVLQLDDSELALAPTTLYSIDHGLTATAEEVYRLVETAAFQPLPQGNATFGFVDGAYWFHVRLLSRDSRLHRRILVLDYALLDQIDLYVRRADGALEHSVSGDMHPFSSRAVSFRAPNFFIDVHPGEQIDLLVRAKSKSSMQVPLKLFSETAFFEKLEELQLGAGVYYGILLGLLLYNLILFASLRDPNYFYYTLYVGGFGLAQLCLSGLAFQYLWPNSPDIANLAIPLSMALAMLLMLQFVRAFLDLKTRLIIGNRVTLGLMGLHAAMLPLSFLIDYRTAVLVGTAAVLPDASVMLGVSLILARRGDNAARILLLAWSALLLGTATYALVSFGLLPKVFITEYGMQIGSAMEVILISLALASRFAALRDENIRIMRSARDELEGRVCERTRELSETLGELASANERLREANLLDGLTGVYNRRYFDANYESMLAESQVAGRAFAVLVVDIDHFKRVNDETGHLVGDDCLRLAASIIAKHVGSGGSLIRYGGEEFVVLLNDTDAEAAYATAESIRAAVASTPLAVNGSEVSLTVSVGVALAAAGSGIAPLDLLQRADEAMYSAKNRGRNEVVVARDH